MRGWQWSLRTARFHAEKYQRGEGLERGNSPPPAEKLERAEKHDVQGWATTNPKPRGGQLRLDHIIYEVESITSACDVFEQITGVRPMIGSKHEALGIHNAAVSLGDGRYLELLAKSPVELLNSRNLGSGAAIPVTVLGVDVQKPRLTTWCCDTRDVGICGLVAELTKLPLKNLFPSEVAVASRTSHGGGRLTWRIAADKHRECHGGILPMGGLVPFLIDWMGEPPNQPGLIAPTGCELIELRAQHPEPADLTAVLRAMRADHLISVEFGEHPRMSAVIRHPKGQLVLE